MQDLFFFNLLPTGRFPTTRCAEILPFNFTGGDTGTEALLQADVKFSFISDSEKKIRSVSSKMLSGIHVTSRPYNL